MSLPRPFRRALTSPRHGFTLVEILVVVVIIGVMTAGFVLAFAGRGADRELETEARRLDALIAYARDRAELQSRDFGLRFSQRSYGFLAFDPQSGNWLEVIDDVLRTREVPDGIAVELAIEGRPVVLPADLQGVALEPNLAISSNGELTPFELTLRRDGSSAGQRLSPAEDGTLELREIDGTTPR